MSIDAAQKKSVWRTTASYLREIIPLERGNVAIVIIGGIVAGSIATIKSLIESRIIQNVADAVDSRSEGTWSSSLGGVGSATGDVASRIAYFLFDDMSFGIGVVVYLLISAFAASFSVWTTNSQRSISRRMFSELYSDGLEAAFSKGEPVGDERHEPGGLAGAIQNGARSVSGAYGLVFEACQYLVALSVILLTLLKVSVYFSILCLLLSLALGLLSWVQGRHLHKRREKYDEQRRDLFAYTGDVLANRDVLLAHERKDAYVGRLKDSAYELGSITQQLSVREQAYFGGVRVIQDIGQIAILAIVLIVVSRGVRLEQVGDAYFYISVFTRLMSPIRGLLSSYDDVRDSMSSSNTLISLLDGAKGLDSKPSLNGDASTKSPLAANFSEVSFGYTSEKNVLSDCTFSVPKGGVTLIVGRSGSGKTTIARMLLGFLAPGKGTVEVFGSPTARWSQQELLGHMSYLAQTGHVIAGSVKENLFAAENVKSSVLHRALCQAGLVADESAAAEALTWDARRLSEGQRQRIALARIFVDESPLVVLDEPLAGVDSFTFSEVRESLKTWMTDPDRTVVLISHRLAFASTATHVVMLGDQGRVVEEDDPTTLSRRSDSVFAHLLSTARAELETSSAKV